MGRDLVVRIVGAWLHFSRHRVSGPRWRHTVVTSWSTVSWKHCQTECYGTVVIFSCMKQVLVYATSGLQWTYERTLWLCPHLSKKRLRRISPNLLSLIERRLEDYDLTPASNRLPMQDFGQVVSFRAIIIKVDHILKCFWCRYLPR